MKKIFDSLFKKNKAVPEITLDIDPKIFENNNLKEVFDHIADKVYDSGVDNDSEDGLIKNLFYIICMHGQVLNGGVIQFVDNSTGDYFEETLAALKDAKATEYIEILERVKGIFPSGYIAKNTSERRDQIDLIFEQENKYDDFLEELDNTYYDNTYKLHKYLTDYTLLYLA